ncbi:MAG: hypothetical protein JO021_13605 [Alphaproteobacteria bacterium]|nr:hypothetical protein [Alphaproteobacteria bacterium]
MRDAGGALELDGPLPPLAIPSSLQASLLARLDRLSAVKEVAQIGAAIGREFEHALLARVARRSDDALAEALDQLAEAGLVFRRGTPPRASYRFKHALVQDAAYSTLLRSRRQELHGRIAQALADDFHDVAANQPEILAHHFSEAGLAERAVEYWQRAGEHALQRSANIEAIAHFTSGVRLIGSLAAGRERDARELALRLALGPALMASRGFGVPEVEATYARSRELCRDLGAGPDLFAALRGLWEYYEIRAHTQTGVELAREAFAIAERSGDPALLVVAHDIVGDTSLWIPDFAAAIEHTTRALALYDPDRDGRLALAHGSYDPTMACRLFGAHALWHQGCADRALQQCRDALAFARALDHPPTSGFVGQIAVHHYLRREPLAVEAHAEAAIAIARQNHLQFWLALATIARGWAAAMLGRADGIEEIRRGIADYRATGAELECSVWAAMLADALLQHGRDEEAGKIAVEALAETARTGVRVFVAELHRLHGRSLARAGAGAEAAFQRAIEVARSQGAKSLELRAATDLARAWLSAGRQDEARGLLRPIHDGFAEGFDTADLEAARTVLG